MRRESLLIRVHQIRRQQQQSIGAALLGVARDLEGHRRAVATARNDRHAPANFRDGRTDDLAHLVGPQREEFASTTGREESRRLVLQQPRDMLSVGATSKRSSASKCVTGKDSSPRAMRAAISEGFIAMSRDRTRWPDASQVIG